jgi:hypothetical protein
MAGLIVMGRRNKFSRTRTTSIEPVGPSTLRAASRLTDRFHDMSVVLTVGLPDLDLQSIQAEVERSYDPADRRLAASADDLVGVRIGPGMTKIFKGLAGDAATADCQLLFLIEEACHGVILSFTKDTLNQTPDDDELTAEVYREMVRTNIRLYNRCAAFAPGSSLVEGVEPPKE